MSDQQYSIEGQSIIKAIGSNLDHKWLYTLLPEMREVYLSQLFRIFSDCLNAYIEESKKKEVTK